MQEDTDTLPVAPFARASIIAGDANGSEIIGRRAHASRHRREASRYLVLGPRAHRRDCRGPRGNPHCRARARPRQPVPKTAPPTQTWTPSPTSRLILPSANTLDTTSEVNSEIDSKLALLSIERRQLRSRRIQRRLAMCRAWDQKMAQLLSMHTFSGRPTPITLHVAFAVVMPYSGRNAKTTVRVINPDGRRRSLVTRPGFVARSKPPEELGSSKAVGAASETSQKVLVLFKPS